MKLIEEKEVIENGLVYIVKTYSNGKKTSVVKVPKSAGEPIEPEETIEPFDNEVAMLELLSMTEYNTCLLEMQMEF